MAQAHGKGYAVSQEMFILTNFLFNNLIIYFQNFLSRKST